MKWETISKSQCYLNNYGAVACDIHSDFLVLHIDLLFGDKRKTIQCIRIQVFMKHIDTTDLAVFVGGVIIDPSIDIAAAGVYGLFVCIADLDAAFLLCHGIQDMKKLTDTRCFRVI